MLGDTGVHLGNTRINIERKSTVRRYIETQITVRGRKEKKSKVRGHKEMNTREAQKGGTPI